MDTHGCAGVCSLLVCGKAAGAVKAAWLMSLPFMVDAEAGQPGDGVSLHQLLQADCTFSCILGQHILWRTRQETDTETNQHNMSKHKLLFTFLTELFITCTKYTSTLASCAVWSYFTSPFNSPRSTWHCYLYHSLSELLCSIPSRLRHMKFTFCPQGGAVGKLIRMLKLHYKATKTDEDIPDCVY